MEFLFAPRARILRWLVDPDEVAMVATFVERECDEAQAEHPDAFVTLTEPFADARQHGLALTADLLSQVEAARAPLAAEGFDSPWTVPPPIRGDDVGTLLTALLAFRSAHGFDTPESAALAVFLDPRGIADADAYAAWLALLARRAPPELRFVVLDHAGSPRLQSLAEVPEVMSVVAGLDMTGAAVALSDAAGNLHTAGGQFRQLFVRMGDAGKRGVLEEAQALCDRAVAIAERAKWPHLVAAARFALGAMLGQAGRHLDAAGSFAEAEAAGAASEAAGESVGPRLRLQARLARGSSLICLGAFARAADHFGETVPLARQVGDARAEVDCWRLSSYCHEQAGDLDRAWEAGLAGLKAGKGLDAETRRTSTLPYLATQMVGLTGQRKWRDYAAPLVKQVEGLLGKGWRPDPKAPPPPAGGAGANVPAGTPGAALVRDEPSAGTPSTSG